MGRYGKIRAPLVLTGFWMDAIAGGSALAGLRASISVFVPYHFTTLPWSRDGVARNRNQRYTPSGVAPFNDLKPIKKFTSRKVAVARIWLAVQRLSANVAQPSREVASVGKTTGKSPVKSLRRARARGVEVESRSSKKAEVIAMMKRPKGATIGAIIEATGWSGTRCAAS